MRGRFHRLRDSTIEAGTVSSELPRERRDETPVCAKEVVDEEWAVQVLAWHWSVMSPSSSTKRPTPSLGFLALTWTFSACNA